MIVCKICGKELASNRQAHGHLTCAHNAEYQKTRDQQNHLHPEKLISHLEPGAAAPDQEEPRKTEAKKPAGLRHLDLTIPDEKLAFSTIDEEYNSHYEYIDSDGFCYTIEECKKRGWI